MKYLLYLFTLIIGCELCACNTTRYVAKDNGYYKQDIGEINRRGLEYTAFIDFTDGAREKGEMFQIQGDSAHWLTQHSAVSRGTPIAELHKVVFSDHGSGALEGLGFGLLGSVVTVVPLSIQLSEGSGLYAHASSTLVAMTAAGVVLAPLTGIMAGGAIGDRKTYVFDGAKP